ncbi:MAG: hypothetical protein K8E66_05245 [Phycisphaerales bacterium]|nr:hypothetical protein [Phycisphaerales bacterium]
MRVEMPPDPGSAENAVAESAPAHPPLVESDNAGPMRNTSAAEVDPLLLRRSKNGETG